ncbi:putative sugar phosphate transporter domain-containing protein [Helianthus annuus]|uniref:Sugar phosphate transporter domain-containing protein n=1 Tax=Helianthus annuus TaxID=4232 RepID=A0A9K3K062_HELAN|nr:putative sugar phosphate transporter domain-containing protein [Helianthus annuus]KAJ0950053.1 putative sugar phosphate transporter domain-containing protein [Helianthus annuus]
MPAAGMPLKGVTLAHTIGHVAATISMSKVVVSFTHIIKSGEPAFSAFVSRFFLGETFPTGVYSSLLPIIRDSDGKLSSVLPVRQRLIYRGAEMFCAGMVNCDSYIGGQVSGQTQVWFEFLFGSAVGRVSGQWVQVWFNPIRKLQVGGSVKPGQIQSCSSQASARSRFGSCNLLASYYYISLDFI